MDAFARCSEVGEAPIWEIAGDVVHNLVWNVQNSRIEKTLNLDGVLVGAAAASRRIHGCW